MGIFRRKQNKDVEENPVMGYVDIKGVGKVEVESMPSNVPRYVKIGNKRVKINKELYLWLWANAHGTKEGIKKLRNIIG